MSNTFKPGDRVIALKGLSPRGAPFDEPHRGVLERRSGGGWAILDGSEECFFAREEHLTHDTESDRT